jgi:hypothetical protein
VSTNFPANPDGRSPEDLGSTVAELGTCIPELTREFGRMSLGAGQEAWSLPGLPPRESLTMFGQTTFSTSTSRSTRGGKNRLADAVIGALCFTYHFGGRCYALGVTWLVV